MQAKATYRPVMIGAMLVALLLASHAAHAEAGGGKSAKLFADEATLPLTITAPWREFAHNKTTKSSYPGTLEYVDDSGAKRAVPIVVTPRGHNRLKVCKFPPIKLIFEKEAIQDTLFHGNRSLKLVTRCANDEQSEQYIIKEMLAYRIYNLVTERSFRVRPLSVTYVDSADRSAAGAHFAFLLEDDSELAKRNNLEKIEVTTLTMAQLESLEASRVSPFEYLIGNTDFALLIGSPGQHCCHNTVLLGENKPAKAFAVPYDFDSSGLVDARYAVPNPILGTESNRERVFRGFCAENATLEAARGELLRLEPQVLELFRAEGRLQAASSEAARDYLSKGFEVLRDDRRFAREVTAKCRK